MYGSYVLMCVFFKCSCLLLFTQEIVCIGKSSAMEVSSTNFQYLQYHVGFLSRVDDAVAKNPNESHRIYI